MRVGLLAALAGLLSCQTATQITVTLRGIGVACPSGDSPTIEQTGVVAKRTLQTRDDLPELSVLGEVCEARDSVVSLGDIVLVPADGPGPVEILALGALKVGDAPAASAEDCRAEYERLFGTPCELGEGKACESCIFARRSVAFVRHSKLELTIDLEAACAGVVCGTSQTCSNGQCVSSETRCDDGGPCVLVNENEGGAGAGAGSAGGSGGAGGAPIGGQGGSGGAGPDSWSPVWDPSMPGCAGASPSDVIADVMDTGLGPRFHVLVPAGPCMLVLEDGEAPLVASDVDIVNDNAYRAVARKGTNDFVSFGDKGFASLLGGTPFSTIAANLTAFSPNLVGVAWDIAVHDQTNFLSWTRTYQDALGTNGELVPFVPGVQDSIFRSGLFAVLPSTALDKPITFATYGATLVVRRSSLSTNVDLTGSADGWAIWAEELAQNPGTFQLVAIGGTTDAAHAGRCTDTTGTANPNCAFAVAPTNPLLSSLPTRKVVALWGHQALGGVDIYVVGNDVGAPWLGRATLPPEGDPAAGLDWEVTDLPAAMQDPGSGNVKSIWVGPDGNGVDTLIVVGPPGVFAAPLDELVFTPVP